MTTDTPVQSEPAPMIRGYRITEPELTTYNRLLDVRDALKERTVIQLKMQINFILEDETSQQIVRAWLQVSDRHSLSRREVFNWIKHQHDESNDAHNWRLKLYVYPVANMFSKHILVRIESGAVCEDWFGQQVQNGFDGIEDLHVYEDDADDNYNVIVWVEQMKLTPHPYTLIVTDDLEEYAQCV